MFGVFPHIFAPRASTIKCSLSKQAKDVHTVSCVHPVVTGHSASTTARSSPAGSPGVISEQKADGSPSRLPRALCTPLQAWDARSKTDPQMESPRLRPQGQSSSKAKQKSRQVLYFSSSVSVCAPSHAGNLSSSRDLNISLETLLCYVSIV